MNEKEEYYRQLAYLNEARNFTLRYLKHWFTKYLAETPDRIPGANCPEKAANEN